MQRVLRTRGTRLLNEGVRAAIAYRDYALAAHVTDLYARLGVAPDAQTSVCVWESLAHVLQGGVVDALADAMSMDEAARLAPLAKARLLLEHMEARRV